MKIHPNTKIRIGLKISLNNDIYSIIGNGMQNSREIWELINIVGEVGFYIYKDELNKGILDKTKSWKILY